MILFLCKILIAMFRSNASVKLEETLPLMTPAGELSSQDEFEADILDKHEDLDDVAETLENR
jgi:hypothetical protein